MKRKIRVTKTVDVEIEIQDDKVEENFAYYIKNIFNNGDIDSMCEHLAQVACDDENGCYETYLDGLGAISLISSGFSEDGIKAVCKNKEFECEKLV